MSNNRPERIFDQLEEQRKNIFVLVKNLDADSLTKQPRPGKWNILEILTHLFTAEKLTLQYMKKKSLGINELDNSGLYEKLKVHVFKISQALPLHYNAPKSVVSNTVVIPFADLEQQWDELRQELKFFLKAIPDEQLKKKIYKHPFLGRLDVNQALIVTREHFSHHTPQILRLIKH